MALLSNAGGLGILCADACEAAGLELPGLAAPTIDSLKALLPAEASLGNPVDMLGSATAQLYEGALPVLLADPGVDAVIVLFVPAAQVEAEEVAHALCRAIAGADRQTKPVLAAVMSSAGIPAALKRPGTGIAPFLYPESAARALGQAADRTDWLRRPAGARPGLDGVDLDGARTVIADVSAGSGEPWLSAEYTGRLLECVGIPLVEQRSVGSVDAAVEAARELGFPAVVKSGAAGIHKSDIHAVALDLGDEHAVRAAAARIGPPLLVQPFVRTGVELLAGLVQDPVFGPLVAFGPGGKLAELIGEATFRIAPLTDIDARELVFSGKAGQLVRGFRADPSLDAVALIDLVHRLALLGAELPEVAELDLNPVLAFPQGCCVVDARIRLRAAPLTGTAKTW